MSDAYMHVFLSIWSGSWGWHPNPNPKPKSICVWIKNLILYILQRNQQMFKFFGTQKCLGLKISDFFETS